MRPVSVSLVYAAVVSLGTPNQIVKPGALLAETEVLVARVSVGGSTQTITPGIVRG